MGSKISFSLRFPIAEEPAAVPQADLSAVRVLVVDDNGINLRILAEQLDSWNMRVATAMSGEEGLKLLRAAQHNDDPYQIAILDFQMSGMDGEVLGRTIKEDAELGQTCLVMMTSISGRGDRKRFEDAGFSSYLVKPVRPSLLMDALATVWGRHLSGQDQQEIVTRHTVKETRALGEPAPDGEVVTGGWRILVAEDNVVNQVMRMLEKLGHRVDLAANGMETVKMQGQFAYDLIMMDCQMPELDGYEATREIREDEVQNGSRVPIIAMTANAMEGDREKCLAVGMDDYVSKPVKQNELAAVLRKFAKS